GIDDARHCATNRYHHAGEGAEVVRVLAFGEDFGVGPGEFEEPVSVFEDSGGCLLFQPLEGVTLIDPCSAGEAGRVERASLAERTVEAEPIAEVDGVEVERGEARLEDAIYEPFGRNGGCGCGHVQSLSW